jgi:hypothetical protein
MYFLDVPPWESQDDVSEELAAFSVNKEGKPNHSENYLGFI